MLNLSKITSKPWKQFIRKSSVFFKTKRRFPVIENTKWKNTRRSLVTIRGSGEGSQHLENIGEFEAVTASKMDIIDESNPTSLRAPPVQTVSNIDYKRLKPALKRLFPERYLLENQQYINVYPHGSKPNATVVECSVFSKVKPETVSSKKKDVIMRKFNLEDAELQRGICTLLWRKNKGIFMKERIAQDSLKFQIKPATPTTPAIHSIDCGGQETLYVITQEFPILRQPFFIPADFGIRVPLQLPQRLPASMKLHILHSDNLQGSKSFDPSVDNYTLSTTSTLDSLSKNIAFVAIDSVEKRSPISVLGIFADRFKNFRENDGNWLDPFYTQRQWKMANSKEIEPEEAKSVPESGYLESKNDEIRVLSYNMLKDSLAHLTENWAHLKEQPELEFCYRQQFLCAEIDWYDADIMGLQESEVDGIPGRYDVISTSDGHDRMPVLTIAYKPEKFELLEQHVVHYQDIVPPQQRHVLDSTRHRLILGRFRCRDGGQEFAFATTHLYFKEDAIRTLQLELLLDYLGKVKSDIPVIITGDMNADLSQSTMIGEKGYKFGKNDGQYTTKLAKNYEGVPWQAKLDWTLYSSYTQTGYLTAPDDDLVQKWNCLPSKMFPSDHIAQGFVLKFHS